MKKISSLVLWLTLSIAGGCCTGIDKVKTPVVQGPELVQKIEDSTVALVEYEGSVSSLYCAGVWITEDKILTANHCAEAMGRSANEIDEFVDYDAVGNQILTMPRSEDENDKKTFHGVVLVVDHNNDLAIIKVNDPPKTHEIVELAQGKIEIGSDVHIVGHTAGMSWTYIRGTVSSSRITLGPASGSGPMIVNALQISSPAWKGNSGGGAFDKNGKLIGISSWVSARAPMLSFFIHRDEIIKFLKEAKVV